MSHKQQQASFLAGGGEMMELIQQYDWSTTPLGGLDQWPLSLRTLVNMMLQAPLPMVIGWGKEHTILHNDAFKALLPDKTSLLGQPANTALHEMMPAIVPICQSIQTGGPAISVNNQQLPLYRNGEMEHIYCNYSAVTGDDGEIGGVLITCTAVIWPTKSIPALNDASLPSIFQKSKVYQQLEDTQQLLLNLFEQAPVAVAVISKVNLTFLMANSFYSELVDRTPDQLVGKSLLEALPEIAGQGFDELLRQVIATGIPYTSKAAPVVLRRSNVLETTYLDFTYQPMRNAEGATSGVLVVATDVTEQVVTRLQIEESAKRLRTLIQSAPVAIGLFVGRDFIIEMPNETFIEVIGRGEDIVGKPLREAMPELESQPFLQILDSVFTSGQPYRVYGAKLLTLRGQEMIERYFDVTFSPIFNEQGEVTSILDISIDVTEQIANVKKVADSEAKFRSLIEEAPFATALYAGTDLIIDVANEAMIELWGKTPDVVGMPLAAALPELEGQPFIPLLQAVLGTGVAYHSKEQSADLVVDGVLQRFWFNFTYKPLLDVNNNVYGILNMAVDITSQVKAREKIEEGEALLALAIELAELATWYVNLVTGRITYSTRMQNWLGLDAATYDPDGSSRIVEEDRDRVQTAFINATVPGGPEKFDEIYSVINNTTGHRRIIHSIGRPLFNNEGKAIGISGTAQDITIQRQAQLALENKVQERTLELAAAIEELQATNEELEESNRQLTRSNEELAQYAYVASHDLQEPLRKISLFSGMLDRDNKTAAQKQEIVQKIQRSTDRMSMLIKDLLEFSRLLKSDELASPVDLQEVVNEIINDFELVIAEKDARIAVSHMPVIDAVRLQMNQLFYNLIGNALKFSRKEAPPVIAINARQATDAEVKQYIEKPAPGMYYHFITVQDNGIGFEMTYLDRIFEVFKQLHGRNEYSGSGVGLSICRRVVQNHKGAIDAVAQPGEGACFYILLPQYQTNNANQC